MDVDQRSIVLTTFRFSNLFFDRKENTQRKLNPKLIQATVL